LGSVAGALAELNDASVTAAAIFLGRSDFGEQDFYRVFLMEAGYGQSAGSEGTAFAKRDHFFRHRTGRFGFGQGGSDALMLNEAANQIGEHGVAVVASSAKFGCAFEVAHGCSVLSIQFQYSVFSRPKGDENSADSAQ
jgi:hypothetical protein